MQNGRERERESKIVGRDKIQERKRVKEKERKGKNGE